MTTPATILFAHSSNELYGSDLVLLELARRLDREKFRPLVVTPTDIEYEGQLGQALEDAGISHIAADIPVLRRRYFSAPGMYEFQRRVRAGTRWLQQLIADEQVALVHSNTSAVWGGALAARRANIPHLWHVHEIITNPRLVRKLIAFMVERYSDKVVAISQAVAEHLTQDQPGIQPRLSVIYDAVDADIFRPDIDASAVRAGWGVEPGLVLAGVVGRISAWKGQDFFLEAFAQATPETPQLRAVIVGDVVPGEDWRLDELKSRAVELGIADRITWAGYRSDIPEVMAALDLLVLPSVRPEPFGMVVLEAMASGRPVIATAHGGPLETIIDGETGYLVPPAHPDDLANALRQLANDPDLCERQGKNGRARAIQEFGFERQVTAFEQLYEKLLCPPDHT